MLAYIEGVLMEHEADGVVILTNSGLGYKVAVPRISAEVGERVGLFLAEVIREDRYDLYGFTTKDEKLLFLTLTDVQGVGPKLGQKILSAASPGELRNYISRGDVNFFTGISGVGKKTAQKIILDLQGILVSDAEATTMLPALHEVTEALLSLGYSESQVRQISEHITGETVEDRVRSALKLLSR